MSALEALEVRAHQATTERLHRVTQERDYFMAETDRLKGDVSSLNLRVAALEARLRAAGINP